MKRRILRSSKEATSCVSTKMGSLLLWRGFKRRRARLDFEAVGGALLLGVKKVVIKSHGSSKAKTITAAVESAANIYPGNLIG